MARKKHTAEEIIGKLREAEVSLAQGKKVTDVCRTLGVSEQTYVQAECGQLPKCYVRRARLDDSTYRRSTKRPIARSCDTDRSHKCCECYSVLRTGLDRRRKFMTTSLRALRVIHFWVETSRVCFPDHFAPSKGRFFWLALNRLGRAGVGAIVDRLRGDTAIPRATAAAMIARAYGVPLFVKELTKAVL